MVHEPERSLKAYKKRHLKHHLKKIQERSAPKSRSTDKVRQSIFYFGSGFAILFLSGVFFIATNQQWFRSKTEDRPIFHTLLNLFTTSPSNDHWMKFHLPWGAPTKDFLIPRSTYVLDFNEEKRLLRWIAFKVQLGPKVINIPKRPDPKIPVEKQGSKEFSELWSKFEHSALVSTTLVGGSDDAAIHLGYDSAKAPQAIYLNQSLMRRLDNMAHNLAKEYKVKNEIWVILGPVYFPTTNFPTSWLIPSFYFHVRIWRVKNQDPKIECYLFPNFAGEYTDNLNDYMVSLTQLETFLGYSLIPDTSWRHMLKNQSPNVLDP